MKQVVFRALMLCDLAEILGCLPANLPPVFLIEGEPRPLKIQIREDLLERFPGADPAKISRWLKMWTSRAHYIKAVCFGTARHDLAGRPAGTVTEDEREHARKQIVGSRKAAEKAAAAAKALPAPPRRKQQGINGRPILHLPSLHSPARAAQ
jgi:sRNA-binding protein